MKTIRITRLVSPVIASLILPLSALAAAPDTIVPPYGRANNVSLSNVDLSTAEGQTTARNRIREMARTLCTRVTDPLDLGHTQHFNECVAQAIDQANAKLSAAILAKSQKSTAPPVASMEAPAAQTNAAQIAAQAATVKTSDPQPDEARLTAKISVSDLDLTTPAGIKAAHERLYQAARTVCTRAEDNFDLSHKANFDKCVDEAMAHSEVNVTELASKQTPRPARLSETR